MVFATRASDDDVFCLYKQEHVNSLYKNTTNKRIKQNNVEALIITGGSPCTFNNVLNRPLRYFDHLDHGMRVLRLLRHRQTGVLTDSGSGLKPGPARPSKTRPAQPNYRPGPAGLGRQIFALRPKIRPGPARFAT